MFTTYRHTEIGLELPEELCSAPHQQLWSCVEQELILPWFYLQVVRRYGRELNATMLMLYHAHELKQYVDYQSTRTWIEQVQLVTPPYMNGQARWLMEPLQQVSLVEAPTDGAHFLVFKVTSGSTYSLRGDLDLTLPAMHVLFCAETDLRHPR
ncbi:hypothetical protein ACQR3P_04185 [Rhodococcus sp. IEGM1300]